MSNLRDLLNPLSDDKQHAPHSSDELGVDRDRDQDPYMGDAFSAQVLGNNGSIDETSQAFWWALNGDVTEADNYLQSSLTNTQMYVVFHVN